MKFDITRATNLVDELSDSELESVYGGFGGFGGFGSAGIGLVGTDATAAETRIHSTSVLCDISIFSLAVNVLPIANIASPMSQTCANND